MKSPWLTRLPLFPVWPEEADLEGIRIPLRDSPLTPRMRRRLLRGLYETEERRLLQLMIRPGDQILELGASVGIVSCFLARAAGPEGRVVSVEPEVGFHPHFEAHLRRNRLRAEWVHALCCPIWGQPLPGEFREQQFQPAANPLSGRAAKGDSHPGGPGWLTAEEICHARALAPTAVVLDIEGTEGAWVRHAPRFPASVRTVLLEVHPRLLGPLDAGRVVQAVLEEGFRVLALDENVLAFERANPR